MTLVPHISLVIVLVFIHYTDISCHALISSAMVIFLICLMRLFHNLAPLFTYRFRSGLGNKLIRPIRVRHTITIDCEKLMLVYEYLLSYLRCLTHASDARVALLIIIVRVHYTGIWYQCNKPPIVFTESAACCAEVKMIKLYPS